MSSRFFTSAPVLRLAGLCPVILLVILAAFAGPARGDNIIDLGAAPGGYTFGANNFGVLNGGGLNNAGQAFMNVNKIDSDGVERHGETFLYSGGQITNIGSLGGPVTFATGINDGGQIVGGSTVPGGQVYDYHPFSYSGGTMTQIGGPNGNGGVATAVNNLGQVVGYAYPSSGGTAFLYSQNKIRYITDLDAPGSIPSAINNSLQITYNVSNSSYVGTFEFGFLRSGGTQTYFQLENEYYVYDNEIVSQTNAINSKGEVVGTIELQNPYEAGSPRAGQYSNGEAAFLYSGGKLTTFATQSGNSSAVSINDAGEIVGTDNGVPFLYVNGVETDINSLLPVGSGWTIDDVDQINDFGQIFGFGTFDGQEHAFILDTAVEPASLALLGAGVMVLGLMRKKLRWPAARG